MKKWIEMDENVIADIHLALADEILSSVEEKRTVKEIWDHLAKLYEAKSFHKKIFFKRKLYTLRMAELASNGVVERMNRTLQERTRAILGAACFGKSFWAETVNTACNVINRSPSTAIELKTPTEMWNGKKADYSNLHIFGNPVYVMYNDQERTKLDPKSRKCIFLGNADGVKGYRL
ncbi:hypothetical protein LIER_27618 [Lithospermum erythrorhizon]|uniref:Integrase catalytic domain-containing protein n=1 Tax=Lithospermum erythrorhizon TaxID=34254 RepID=A0AAV3RDV7_LITER